MRKLFCLALIALTFACNKPRKNIRVPKGLDGIEVINPQDGVSYRLQYIHGKGYYPVAADTVLTSDSTFYLKFKTIR